MYLQMETHQITTLQQLDYDHLVYSEGRIGCFWKASEQHQLGSLGVSETPSREVGEDDIRSSDHGTEEDYKYHENRLSWTIIHSLILFQHSLPSLPSSSSRCSTRHSLLASWPPQSLLLPLPRTPSPLLVEQPL